ncbi:MAG: hypothetical protein VX808_08075, partial [Actinomycetota bacterium]|nr:hypothetical protein [Actinomycetota bacterium]
IVVVEGRYDHVEFVLGALDLPYQAIKAGHLGRVHLRPEQLLVINCPGQLTAPEIVRVRDFVATGGTLFSTDWALRNVLEPAFPGFVEFNEHPTHDDVVRIDIIESDSPYLTGVLDSDDDPQWWLEGSSYPIRVLDKKQVRVLITSRELGEKYGEEPVAVVFNFGKGEVFHMISHYFLQRAEFRNTRHQKTAASYAADKGVPFDKPMADMASDLYLYEVEAAATSSRMFANIASEKKRRFLEEQRRRQQDR